VSSGLRPPATGRLCGVLYVTTMTGAELKRRLTAEMAAYLESYVEPAPGTTIGIPWSKDKIATEIDQMKVCLVEPFAAEYKNNDEPGQEPTRRSCWVVATDDTYGLVFDLIADEYVLVSRSSSSASNWASFGIRGDAVSTFLAR
jgi:hypothetical protein